MTDKVNPRYLGDGVYLSHDGWQHWLAVNNHENHVVALDPQVLFELIRQAAKEYDKNFYSGHLRAIADMVEMQE